MTKKAFVVLLVALLAVFTVLGVSSEARTMEFEYFSIDVPDGWQVNEDKKNSAVIFAAPDDSGGLTVSVFENKGMPLEEIAEMLMNALNGENLAKSGGAYTFQFENGGYACTGVVGGDEMIVFLSIIGENDDIEKMIDSLKLKS